VTGNDQKTCQLTCKQSRWRDSFKFVSVHRRQRLTTIVESLPTATQARMTTFNAQNAVRRPQ
jgi:hypothetical protein